MSEDLYSILDSLSIEYELINHPPVFTSEEARKLVPQHPATAAKNLFLRDKKGKRHFLLVIDDRKSARFKDIEKQTGISHLSMASPARLKKYLGIEPGAVSMLALINDTQGDVELLIDRSLWEGTMIQAHPLINTATVVMMIADMQRFIEHSGHVIHFVDID